jgi:branched-chain amino acid transport system substrate-binding protein
VSRRPRYLLASVAFFALVAAACGQFEGVHERGIALGETGGNPGAVVDGTLQPSIDPETGAIVDPETGATIDPGTGTTPTTTNPGTDPGTDPGGDDDDPPPPTGGGDRTGVTDKTITIGIHAPVTGAAPVRSDSFETGTPKYWKYGNNGKPVVIHGRTVNAIFRDDKYVPSTARSVCQQMAEEHDAFLLIGGAGTDQIKACAEYAASRGIPYLSAGVTEIGLRGLRNYFGLSMSYPQQIPLLAQYVKKNRTDLGWDGTQGKLVMIATDTANFDDAVNAWKKQFPGSAVIRPSKTANGESYADDVCQASVERYQIVFPLTSPDFFLRLEGAAACNPQYVGVGISMGLNTVARTGCDTATGSMNGSRFFSPFYAYADTAGREDTFRGPAQGKDDIEFALWGLSKTLHQLFLKAGRDLTREGFIAAAERATGIRTGVFPDLSFSPSNHFGANQVHVLRADCSRREFVTESFFKSSF